MNPKRSRLIAVMIVVCGCGHDDAKRVSYDKTPDGAERVKVADAAILPAGDRPATISYSPVQTAKPLEFEGFIEQEPETRGPGIAQVEVVGTGADGKRLIMDSFSIEAEMAAKGRVKYRLPVKSPPTPGRYRVVVSYRPNDGDDAKFRVVAEGDLDVVAK
jgi:hypothetical protein